MGTPERDEERFEGFESWYLTTWARLVAALALVDGDMEAALDAASEAFTRSLKDWSRVGRMDNRDGWVYRVGMNVQRRRLRRAAMEDRLLRRQPGTRPAGSAPETLADLRMSIADLPRRQRVAIVLTYFADLNQHQVAEVMGVTRGTVGSTLSDARASLSAVWKEQR